MNVRHIILDDTNPLHRELAIYRTGNIGTVRLSDNSYRVYSSLDIDAHDLAALFHYGIIEALNTLPFISESGNGLDSWDEAFLPAATTSGLLRIIEPFLERLEKEKPQRILIGWQDEPQKIGYWRQIDPERSIAFLRRLKAFASEAATEGFDLEFLL